MSQDRQAVEVDTDLLVRAARALTLPADGRTAEEALRQAADRAEEHADRAERQRRYLEDLGRHLDLDVLASDEMWR